MDKLRSCNTFVVLPPLTAEGVIFGKNSDRPVGEVQEVVYFPPRESLGSIKCTYIEVEDNCEAKAVILSKPAWMWGAEMGANDCGVVIGNEAIWTKDNDGDHDPSVKRLLGMDLVRLGLERSSTSDEALEIITSLLKRYGQGGPCSATDSNFTYHNSYLIADPNTAWILETSGKHWAALQITSGHYNISNALTITTKMDKHSEGLLEYAKEKGLWNGSGEFNFALSFSDTIEHSTQKAGSKLLATLTESKNFREKHMFHVLRDLESGICGTCDQSFPSLGSQVSVLRSSKPCIHWFTGTPDPSKSVYKPFVFTKNVVPCKHTKSPEDNNREHILYTLHKAAIARGDPTISDILHRMENDCITELDELMENIGDDLTELDELFKDCVETEVKFYR